MSDSLLKICTKCKEEKSLDNFSKDQSKKDGLLSKCKSCFNLYYIEKQEYFNIKYKEKKNEKFKGKISKRYPI